MTLTAILLLLASHFVGDFLLQSDQMALKKSSSNLWLNLHALTYIAVMVPLSCWFFWGQSWYCGSLWLAGNYVAHFCTDYVTSRITARLHAAGERHWFFVTIGADQLIHYATLLSTFAWIAEP